MDELSYEVKKVDPRKTIQVRMTVCVRVSYVVAHVNVYLCSYRLEIFVLIQMANSLQNRRGNGKIVPFLSLIHSFLKLWYASYLEDVLYF